MINSSVVTVCSRPTKNLVLERTVVGRGCRLVRAVSFISESLRLVYERARALAPLMRARIRVRASRDGNSAAYAAARCC